MNPCEQLVFDLFGVLVRVQTNVVWRFPRVVPVALVVLAVATVAAMRPKTEGQPARWRAWPAPLKGRWLRGALKGASLPLVPASGLIGGMYLLSAFTDRMYLAFDPLARYDGQYVFALVLPYTVGATLGTVSGFALWLIAWRRQRTAGAILVIVAAASTAFLGWMYSGSSGPDWASLVELPGEGAPLLWVGLVAAWGSLLLRGAARIPRDSPKSYRSTPGAPSNASP